MIGRSILSTMFAVALLAAVPAVSFADQNASIEELTAKLASTPEEHHAVAEYYRAKAADARAEAQKHRTMAATYTGSKYVQKQAMADHCQKLVATYEALAADYDALAADHDASAK
jgi:hypothetical protein